MRRMGVLVLTLVLPGTAAAAVTHHAYMPITAPPGLVVFETATGAPLAALPLPGDGPTDVAASADGATILVAADCDVVVVDGRRNRVRERIAAPAGCCAERLATDPTGRIVLALDASGGCSRAWLVDSAGGRVTAQTDSFGRVYAFGGPVVSPDGGEALLLVTSEGPEEDTRREVVVIDTASGAVRRRTRSLDTGDYGEAALSPDGGTLLVGDWYGAALTALDPATLAITAQVPIFAPDASPPNPDTAYSVRGLAYDPGGVFVAVVLSERYSGEWRNRSVVQLRAAGSLALLHQILLDGPAGRPAVDADSGLLLVPLRDAVGRLAVIDPATGLFVARPLLGEGPVAVAIGRGPLPLATTTPTPRSTPARTPGRLASCAYIAHLPGERSSGGLSSVDAAQHRLSRWLPIGQPPTNDSHYDGVGAYGVASSPDGATVYVSTSGAVLVVDAATNAVRGAIPVGSGAGVIAVRPDGRIAYVAKPTGVAVVDLASGAVVDGFFTGAEATDIAFTPDGGVAYVTRLHDADSVLVVNAQAHRVSAELAVWDGSGYDRTWLGNRVAVAADGRAAYVTIDHTDRPGPGAVAVIDGDAQVVRARWPLPVDGALGAIAVDPGGRRVYVAIDPQWACRDDPVSGECVYKPNTIAVLDAATGATLHTLPLGGHIAELAVSPDGAVLYATDDRRGLVHVIDPATDSIIDRVTLADSPGRLAFATTVGGCPVGAPLPTRTPPPARRSSFTPATLTPTPSATPPGCAEPCIAVEAGAVSGLPGERVAVEVRLHSSGLAVAGVDSVLAWGLGLAVPERLEQRPDCAVDPAIDKPATVFGYGPGYLYDGAGPFPCWAGYDCTQVRALVLAIDNVDPIADGAVLYRCQVAIDPDAAPGRYPLRIATVEASDPAGQPLAGRGIDGVLEVLSAGAPQAAGSGSASAGGGCAIGGAATHTGALPLLLLAAALATRSWTRRGRR